MLQEGLLGLEKKRKMGFFLKGFKGELISVGSNNKQISGECLLVIYSRTI